MDKVNPSIKFPRTQTENKTLNDKAWLSENINMCKVVVGDRSRRQPEGSLFNSYYTDWSTNSRTTIPQSIALTITPRDKY